MLTFAIKKWQCYKYHTFFSTIQALESAKPHEKKRICWFSGSNGIHHLLMKLEKKITTLLHILSAIFNNCLFLVLYPKFKIHWWTWIFCIILDPCFRVSMEIHCFPSFGLFCKKNIWPLPLEKPEDLLMNRRKKVHLAFKKFWEGVQRFFLGW